MKDAANPRENSLHVRLMAYFEANPDEYLTYEDIMVKFSVSLSTAQNAVVYLKARGKPIASGTFIYKKAAA